ncbi:MAG: hypothetical protein EAZ95_09360 [Bacteroidetes bacterium]|nr:MAG: hypothetical protein EAZ95_09360 [Bacteroidota bacterium]
MLSIARFNPALTALTKLLKFVKCWKGAKRIFAEQQSKSNFYWWNCSTYALSVRNSVILVIVHHKKDFGFFSFFAQFYRKTS